MILKRACYKLILGFLVILPGFLEAEGSAELGQRAKLFLYKGNTNQYPPFGLFHNTNSAYRLHIHIKEPGEKILMGFHSDAQDIKFRLKSPNGNVVFGGNYGTILPQAGQPGHIDTFPQAQYGPVHIDTANGYIPVVYNTLTSGDYYLEFDFPSGNREIDIFDITVITPDSTELPGRVWSKSWLLSSGTWGYGGMGGRMFIYTDDGIVSRIRFNGMDGYFFTFSANKNGVFNTGSFEYDRKSRDSLSLQPQYKIFLNNPDSIAYPTGEIGSITSEPYIKGCPPDQFYFVMDVNMQGEVILDLSFADPSFAPRSITYAVNNGTNHLPWDGKDGRGNTVSFGAEINISSVFINGLTNIPLYDIEENHNGFKVDIVRPHYDDPIAKLFWDDTEIPDGQINLLGCTNIDGCHSWPVQNADWGNERTINTWWFAPDNVYYTFSFTHNFLSFNNSNIVVTPVSCNGLSDGEIIISARGGTPPYLYSLNGSPFSSDTVFSNLNVGWHNVLVKDHSASGCFIDTSFYFEVFSPIRVESQLIQPDTCLAQIGKACAFAEDGTPPYSYEWLTDSIQYDDTAQNLKHGWVYLKVYDSFSCQFDSLYIPHVNYNLLAQVSVKNDTCLMKDGWFYVNESATKADLNHPEIKPAYPFTYNWSLDSITFSPDTIMKGLTQGLYNVKIKDKFGCEASSEKYLYHINPDFDYFISTVSDTCMGNTGKIVMDSIIPAKFPLSYIWYSKEDSILGTNITEMPYFTNLDSGYYFFKFEDQRGCIDSNIFYVPEHKNQVQPDSLLLVNDTCGYYLGSAKVLISGEYAPYHAWWNTIPPRDSTLFVNQLTDSSYKFFVYDRYKCQSDTLDFEIVNAVPEILYDTIILPDTCLNELASYELFAQNGTPPYNFFWNYPEYPPACVTDSSLHIQNLAAGEYVLYIQDQNCIDTSIISIPNFRPKLVKNVYANPEFCNAENGSIKIIPDNVTGPPYYIKWYQENLDSALTLYNLNSGIYSFYLSDKYGCFLQDTLVIKDSLIDLDGSISTIQADTCYSSVGKAKLLIPENATLPATYTWKDNEHSIISQTSEAENLKGGESYSCVLTDMLGCSDTALLIMDNNTTALVDSVAIDPDICNSGSGEIQVIINEDVISPKILWLHQPDLESYTASGLHEGLYLAEVSDKFGCVEVIQKTIESTHYSIDANIIKEKDTCRSGVGKIMVAQINNGEQPYSYRWYKESDSLLPLSYNSNLTRLHADSIYYLHIYDRFGCKGHYSAQISNYHHMPEIQYEVSHDKCNSNVGEIFVNVPNSHGPINYVWKHMPNDNINHIEKLSKGIYTIMVIDKHTCVAGASISVNNDCMIRVPNVITPNDDGLNDFLLIPDLELFKPIAIQIFDRWGNMVFESNEYSNLQPWKGKDKNGKPLPDGTYFYVLFIPEEKIQSNGTISLLE